MAELRWSRVTHVSFDFEAVTAVGSLDLLANLRGILGEVTIAICPPRGPEREAWRRKLPNAQLFTDSMGLVKAVRLGTSGSLSDQRRRIVLDLREAISTGQPTRLTSEQRPAVPRRRPYLPWRFSWRRDLLFPISAAIT